VIVAEPTIHRWTRTEYQQMLDLGWFVDRHVELIEGDILESLPMRNAHAVSLKLTEDVLAAAFGPGHWVRSQLPLAVSEFSEPLPDLAVVPGKPRDYAEHPKTALLVVEIGDSTLAYDRKQKSGLYAAAGLAEYWIVNLVDRQLEIHMAPAIDPSWPSGWRCMQRTILDSAQHAPLRAAAIPVADLLP
jgi:Uma2 family endonuclease